MQTVNNIRAKYRSNWRRCKQCNVIFTQEEDDICLMCKKVCYKCKFKHNDGTITHNAVNCVNVEKTLFRCAICGLGFDIESKEYLKSSRKK